MNSRRDSHRNVGRWGGLVLSLLLLQSAYDTSWAAVQIDQTGIVPILRVNVVSRSTKAVNYRHRGGATKVDFAGTALQPKAYGEAKVETKKGYTEIEVEFDDLEPAKYVDFQRCLPRKVVEACSKPHSPSPTYCCLSCHSR